MSDKRSWKPLVLNAYRWSTAPLRMATLAWERLRGAVPIAVLFYHRVDDRHLNPWTITNRQFQRHLDWLADRFDFVSLEECQQRMADGFNDRPAVSITFDDGYADNCLEALPLLVQRGIPVTYFVAVGNALTGQPFPHDVERRQPLVPNSLDSLRALASAGVEIGSHTRWHVDMGSIDDPARLTDELVTATHELEEAIGTRIRYFAFPYGQVENLNPTVFQMARDYGFAGVCSASGGFNEVGADPFHLRRIHGDPEMAFLKNWLTYDPRKRWHQPSERGPA
jgi:peptidoglycan/xylan/chitin deacetylase (PgdA/CDA1 family)